MIAKKHPLPDPGHAEQTRKVDSMSELVAGMLLEEQDAASSSPRSEASLSAVRPSALPRPPSAGRRAIEEQPRRPGGTRAILIALILALGLVAVLAVLLLVR